MNCVCTGGPGPRPSRRPLPRWHQVLLGAATAAWRAVTRQRPLAMAPGLLGQPSHHPESMRRLLPRRHERWLARLDAELWPSGECADITRRHR
jgi:hypothetical protein